MGAGDARGRNRQKEMPIAKVQSSKEAGELLLGEVDGQREAVVMTRQGSGQTGQARSGTHKNSWWAVGCGNRKK